MRIVSKRKTMGAEPVKNSPKGTRSKSKEPKPTTSKQAEVTKTIKTYQISLET